MLISATALLPVAIRAQPVQGLYVSLGAGANSAGNLLSDPELTKVYTTVGPVGLADLGWGFGNGLRLEIEGSYRSNSISGISTRRVNGTLDPLGDVNGRDVTYAVMANIAYDIPAHPFGLQPYVGAGVGYGWLDFGHVRGNGFGFFRLPNDNIFGPAPDRVSFGTAGALAYQGMAGTAPPLPGVPGLSATLEYRFFGMASPDVPINRVTTTSDTVNGITPSNSTHNRFIVADHAILIGLRYSFGRPPAPAPAFPEMPVPAAAPTRSYLVFFDWDRATLSDRARQIIADAAAASIKVATTRIEANGYTDTSGTSKYNQGLSMRRADAVAAELVKDGVSKAAISIQGFGETHLLVPTGPGVREPRNRRVEIVIR